jgi:ABC-type lipoprotein export system ATPase subunit
MIANLFKHKTVEIEPNAPTNINGDQPIIQLKKIVKTFNTAAGEFVVLKGVDANFYRGEFVGVIGKSGSGKSTMVNMITGIDHPTSGEVFVEGTPIHTLSENQMSIWRGRHLGIVFQFFQLLPTLSLLENLMLPMDFCNMYTSRQRKERAMDLLRQVEMHEHADKLPSAISGGQQQRVAIARALANDPPIIIADEPTGNLDSHTAESVFLMFENMVKEGKTIVMVTHDSSLAKRLSRTVLIADGELVNEWVARALPTLTHQQMLSATHQMKPLQYAPGEEIICQDAPGDRFYIITQGTVEIALNRPGGHNVVVAHMNPGEYFGEIETYRGNKAIATVRAGLFPVEALSLDRQTFLNLISESEATRQAVERIVQLREAENRAARGKSS